MGGGRYFQILMGIWKGGEEREELESLNPSWQKIKSSPIWYYFVFLEQHLLLLNWDLSPKLREKTFSVSSFMATFRLKIQKLHQKKIFHAYFTRPTNGSNSLEGSSSFSENHCKAPPLSPKYYSCPKKIWKEILFWCRHSSNRKPSSLLHYSSLSL